MNKSVLITGAILGILSIVLGAFAAHGLKKVIPAESITTFETGVKYQMYHALLLLFVGSSSYVSLTYQKIVCYLVIAGVILFSGSIYMLATNVLTSFDFKKIGFVTPIGGVLLILSWVFFVNKFFEN